MFCPALLITHPLVCLHCEAWWSHTSVGRAHNCKENKGTKERNWLSGKPCTSYPGNYTPCGLWVLQLDILIGLCSHFVHCTRFTTGHVNRANVAQGEIAPLLGFARNGCCCRHQSNRPSSVYQEDFFIGVVLTGLLKASDYVWKRSVYQKHLRCL